jgi:hypothetical protein
MENIPLDTGDEIYMNNSIMIPSPSQSREGTTKQLVLDKACCGLDRPIRGGYGG